METHKLIKFLRYSNSMEHQHLINGLIYVKKIFNLDKLPDFKHTFPKFKGVNPEIYFKNFDKTSLDLCMKMLSIDPARRISMK